MDSLIQLGMMLDLAVLAEHAALLQRLGQRDAAVRSLMEVGTHWLGGMKVRMRDLVQYLAMVGPAIGQETAARGLAVKGN